MPCPNLCLQGDPQRIILSSSSYGGRGLYFYAAERPYVLAALAPMAASMEALPPLVEAVCCASGDRGCCPPIWHFVGGNDKPHMVSCHDGWDRGLRAQAQRTAASEVKYTKYEWAPPPRQKDYSYMTGHAPYELAWAGNHTALHDWLLKQVCETCTGPNITTPSGPDVSWLKSVPDDAPAPPKKKKKKKKKTKAQRKKEPPADKVAASENPSGATASGIPALDASAQAFVSTSGQASFVMYHPAHCIGCDAMQKFWALVNDHYPGRIYEIFCDGTASKGRLAKQRLCDKVAVPDQSPNPVFSAWRDQQWVQYAGEKNPEALASHIKEVIAAESSASSVVPNTVSNAESRSPRQHVDVGNWEDAEEDSEGEQEQCSDETLAVRQCDQVGMYAIEASPTPALVKFDPTVDCPTCDTLRSFWDSVAAELAPNVTVWRALCTEPANRGVCKDRGIAAGGSRGSPVFDIWTGTVWRRYAGVKTVASFRAYLRAGAYLDGADPRHLTEQPLVKGNSIEYSYAKHKARSPQTDWASLGAPWPEWKPCDPVATFESLCAPVVPTCTRNLLVSQGQKGLGNALFRYAAEASEAFAENCTVDFADSGAESGSLNQFRLSRHCVVPPPRVPTRNLVKHGLQPGPCTLYAITQPLPGSLVAGRLAAIWEGTSAEAPVVGIHLRTGWSDTIALHGEWDRLQCDDLAGHEAFEPTAATMWVLGHVPEFSEERAGLDEILERTMDAADGAFGARRWKFFVASDSVLAKQRVAAFIGERALATRAVQGQIGHNNAVWRADDAAFVSEVGASAVADFVALRDSDMLLGWNSNFPKRAGQGSVCPKRWMEMRSRTRDDDVRLHVEEMDALLRHTMPDGFQPKEPRPLREHVPPGHPCLRADDPLRDCACYYKFALGGRAESSVS